MGGVLTLELGSLEAAKCLMERLQNKHGFGLMAVCPALLHMLGPPGQLLLLLLCS